MTLPAGFGAFIGNGRVVEILGRAVEGNRIPQALIFSGPEGVGKKTLALLLAQRLNCLQPEGRLACGTCVSCGKISGAMHPDVRIVEPQGAFIKIEQIRSLIGEIAFQPFEAQYRLVVLDGADKMRQEAANCLLKTLEEPASRTIMVLIASRPYLLLQTVHSRCHRIPFVPIPERRIERYLVDELGWMPEEATLAATFSGGSLGAAIVFDRDRHREVRKQALDFVSLLFQRGRFSDFSPMAAEIAKKKDVFEIWIGAVELLLQDIYYAEVSPSRISQPDLVKELMEFSQKVSRAGLISILGAVKELKAALLYNVNRQIALESLFLSFR
jgi:DNA polymerase-3 subunit delta'